MDFKTPGPIVKPQVKTRSSCDRQALPTEIFVEGVAQGPMQGKIRKKYILPGKLGKIYHNYASSQPGDDKFCQAGTYRRYEAMDTSDNIMTDASNMSDMSYIKHVRISQTDMSRPVYGSDMSVRSMSSMSSMTNKGKNQYHDSDYESDQGWDNEPDYVIRLRENREEESGTIAMDVDEFKSGMGTVLYFSDSICNSFVEPSITAGRKDMKLPSTTFNHS